MRTKHATILAVLMFAVSNPALLASPKLSELGWLDGKWKRETRNGTAWEVWTRLGDRTLEGRSFSKGASGEERVLEELRLVEMGGEVFYVSKVSENAYPVAFKMTSLAKRTAVFENPTHDFPTRITYTLRDDGSLLAFIEGPGGPEGKAQRIDYVFVRD